MRRDHERAWTALRMTGGRRQKWMELMWGDADYHRELVAQALEV